MPLSSRLPAWTLAVALLPCLAALSPSFADRLDATSVLGAPATVTVAGDGDVAVVGFLLAASDATKVSIKIKRAKKSTLELDVRLLRPDGTVFDPAAAGGKAKPKAQSYSAKFAGVGQAGIWRVEVRGANATAGDCTVTVKAKEKTKVTDSAVIPASRGVDVEFDVPSNSEVAIKMKKAKGASVVPNVEILDPHGNPVNQNNLGKTSDKKGSFQIKKLRLPLFGTYTLRITGKSGLGGSVSYSISTKQTKFKGAVPVAGPGPAFGVEPGAVGRLDASESSPGDAFLWTQVNGEPVELSDPTSPLPTFTAPVQPGTLGFELVRGSGTAFSRGIPFAVEVGPRPVADAGRSFAVDAGAAATLDGGGSVDRAERGLSYTWRQLGGDAVVLNDRTAVLPSFDAPGQNGVLRFGLVVDDGNSRSAEDEVAVVVGDAGRSVADAGREQVVGRVSTVHLSGLASLRPGATLGAGFQWTQISGNGVELSGADGPTPSFTAPRQAMDLGFRLVLDADEATADTVFVHVRALHDNVVGATVGSGPLTFASGTVPMNTVPTLDPDGDELSFRWAQFAGPLVPLVDVDQPSATATIPDDNELYQFVVQAFDGLQYASPDLITVTRLAYAGLPLANAGGDVGLHFPGVAMLDGSVSRRTDGTQDPVTHGWEQVSGKDWYDVAARDPGFDPTAALPMVELPEGISSLTPTRTLTFRLTVNDGTADSLSDLVSINVTNIPLNGVPIVTADVDEDNPIVGLPVAPDLGPRRESHPQRPGALPAVRGSRRRDPGVRVHRRRRLRHQPARGGDGLGGPGPGSQRGRHPRERQCGHGGQHGRIREHGPGIPAADLPVDADRRADAERGPDQQPPGVHIPGGSGHLPTRGQRRAAGLRGAHGVVLRRGSA